MRHSKYTILIICEGENTEPYFFRSIRDQIIKGIYDVGNVNIVIRPEPKDDDDEIDGIPPSSHKYKREKIQIRKTTVKIEPEEPVYALPLKWVKEGQKELEDRTFNEVWTVFDNDNHPARKEAFEEAEKTINGTHVKIAFSSICFEYYLLLHFEKIYKTFQTAECRYKDKTKGKSKPINCNSGVHEKDCFGKRCIGGYARKKGYWTNSKEKNSTFNLVKDKLETGFENSAWLRFVSNKSNPGIPKYELNPYISTDSIVKRLVGKEDINWTWISLNQEYRFKNIQIRIDDNLQIHFENLGTSPIIIPQNSFWNVTVGIEKRINFGKRIILEPSKIKNHALEIVNPEQKEWFIFQYENYRIMFDNDLITNVNNIDLIGIVKRLKKLTHKELRNLIEFLKNQFEK